jgi:hypothetical protein
LVAYADLSAGAATEVRTKLDLLAELFESAQQRGEQVMPPLETKNARH